VTVDGSTIRDLGSRNGTFVNDKRVTGAVPVGHGDEIRIGRTRLIAYLASPDLPTVADGPRT
jgi:pSer/pThr/pTyr-binding forkhead associated (FHA) protein